MDYYTVTTRSMLAAVKEVGAMPFILFEYYLTWQTAPKGIKPSLERICRDLGMKPTAVCNLRSRLVKASWIQYENGEVFILKSFTKNESDSQKMKGDSLEMNESSTKNEQLYKEENNHSEITEKQQKKTKNIGVSDDPPEMNLFRQELTAFQNEYAKPTTKQMAIANNRAIRKLFELANGDTEVCKEVHRSLQNEHFRNGRVDWTTVVKNFNFYQVKRNNVISNENDRGTQTTKQIENNGRLDTILQDADRFKSPIAN